MNLFKHIGRFQRFLKATDWAVAVVSLGYGFYRMNWWWIGAGVVLFILAWLDPGTRITHYFSTMKRPAAGAAVKKGRDGFKK